MESHVTPFWLVWTTGGNAPNVKHKTQEAAEQEAERLVRSNGKTFYVLAPVLLVAPADVRKIAFDSTFSKPFSIQF